MMPIGKGIVHLSFAGGGMFLPARSPYERQRLMRHVARRLLTKGSVQVLTENSRWMVHPQRGTSKVACCTCDRVLDYACYSNARGNAAYCVQCAFGDGLKGAPVSEEGRAVA